MGACTEEFAPDTPIESELLVVFSTEPMVKVGQMTKAIDDSKVNEEIAVADFWVFQYNQKGAFIGKPRYYRNGDPVSILKPSEPGVTYSAVFIANTHDSSLNNKIDYLSISALKASGKEVLNSSELVQKGYDDLMLNGVVDITSQTEGPVKCQLFRNVLKLSVKIVNNQESGMTIKSVQLRNVNNKLFYADRLYDGDDRNGKTVPSQFDVKFSDFELDQVKVSPGADTTLVYYLTRNMRGVADSGKEADKNSKAPPYSTYLEVVAVHDNTPVKYQFYLGKNNSNDFNLEPNYLYNITLTFKNQGEDDDRFENIGVYDFKTEEGDANSYIVNPLRTNLGRRFVIHAADRINAFWGSEAGRENASNNAYADYRLDKGPWVAEVIWQDIPTRVISFCDTDGYLSDRFTGTVDDKAFSFVLTSESEGLTGNVLIGVRKQDSQAYLWSWHIWLTDYEPNSNVGGWVQGEYVYQVKGGSLHKYPSFETVEVNGRILYENKFIMDRNLGATGVDVPSPNTSEDERVAMISRASGLYYAYGRKDPFPGGINPKDKTAQNVTKVLYGIDGTQLTDPVVEEQGPARIYQSVNQPFKYYVTASFAGSGEDWAANESNKWRKNDWNDINIPASKDGQGKSFFDPCPPGWKLPHERIFDAFGDEKYLYAFNCSSWTTITLNDFAGYGGWLIYLEGAPAWDERDGDVVYYPASGLKKYEDGTFADIGAIGTMWTALPALNSTTLDWDRGYYLYYKNESGLLFSHPRPFHRYLGMPVRCIQE